MSKEPTRYPLAWPAHRPRTPLAKRRASQFRTRSREGRSVPLSVAEALDRIEYEMARLDATYPLISTNVEPRLDGRPRSGQAAPTDAGVCVYFNLAGKPIALACDTYFTVEGNLGAVAAHLEATRAIARHGVATAAETLQAFSALPPPGNGPAAAPQRPWRAVMGFSAGWETGEDCLDREEAVGIVQARYRRQAQALGPEHPDLKDLNVARDAALKELKA